MPLGERPAGTLLLCATALLGSCQSLQSTDTIDANPQTVGNLRAAVDLHPDPRVLEVELVAQMARLDLTGDGLFANVYSFNGLTPGPELRLQVGDEVIVHFTNRLPDPMSIHWHGIELDNPNDGTMVTQNPVHTGESFTYRFKVPRPGVFWYHPHAMPTNAEFKGLYGPLIVEDPHETTLRAAAVLPTQSQTLVLSDITVCKAPGDNDATTFAPNPKRAWAFTDSIGPFPGNTAYPTPRDLCETPRGRDGESLDTGPLAAGDIPNVKPEKRCGPRIPCRVNEGQLVLTNGRVASPRAGTPEQPASLSRTAAAVPVRAGSGQRLQLINAAVSRYFRLRLTDQQGRLVPLYRIGGEGGLLDAARVEGGMQGQLDTLFTRGEIVLGSADRSDVVFRVPDGQPGDVLTLWTLDYQRYGTTEYPFGYGGLPTVPVAHFRITDRSRNAPAFTIASGTPLRTHPDVSDPVESIKDLPVTATLADPGSLTPPRPGSDNPELLFTVVGLRESIDGIHGTPLEGGEGDYRDIPHIPSSRFARVGDLLDIRIRNGTQMHHPIHLHGFSFQPVRMLDTNGNTVYEYDYNEFVDTVDVPSTKILEFRVRLDDRPMIEDGSAGGALGRWLFHCHIFNHAAIGMITELVVLDAETP
ncbi:MAG: multicopper oxidase domain-containing protein [Gammaproteobacteria bacterium]|nr:multicopper oxidase domain-containing protein [Gammaproteobacteria bacterium]